MMENMRNKKQEKFYSKIKIHKNSQMDHWMMMKKILKLKSKVNREIGKS